MPVRNKVGPSTNGAVPEHFPLPLQEPFEVELETGRVVQMVIGELSMLLEAGDIPNDLLPIAVAQIYPPDKFDERAWAQQGKERLRLAKWLVGKVLRTPIGSSGPSAALTVDQLYHEEIWEIYGMANRPARALDNFRRQQARHVAVVSAMQDVGPVAEPAPGGDQ